MVGLAADVIASARPRAPLAPPAVLWTLATVEAASALPLPLGQHCRSGALLELLSASEVERGIDGEQVYGNVLDERVAVRLSG